MRTSALDDVPGLGPGRRKRLIAELGGVKGVRTASLEDLESLSWLPTKVAHVLYGHLHPEHPGSQALAARAPGPALEIAPRDARDSVPPDDPVAPDHAVVPDPTPAGEAPPNEEEAAWA